MNSVLNNINLNTLYSNIYHISMHMHISRIKNAFNIINNMVLSVAMVTCLYSESNERKDNALPTDPVNAARELDTPPINNNIWANFRCHDYRH